MRNKYSKLTDTQLRELCLKGEIEHKYMSDDDYELLIQYECDLPAPSSVVVVFCRSHIHSVTTPKKADNCTYSYNH
jgi:hypothetical protein